ncbi:hypothetical protein [Fructobacillus parabroussonetiae]|uniref:Uncharacterized protein n=1 Tax=Fructobacillus parabroussonetiae TaxID=2713174 RepID=A0ABS5QVH7_9LACO|nr:hypothetical protein [Fructobacillus parabroussonetiae]MBS9337206.1 hypothetical protein [Fructobacillus parabroussonetiae]
MQKNTSYPKLNIMELDFSKHPRAHLVKWQGHKIALATTKPNYGGKRFWLVCPYCEKRKGALYQVGQAVICRVCAGLYYAGQDNKARRHTFTKIMALHDKQLNLINNLDPGLYNSYMGLGHLLACDLAYRLYNTPKRPKGMHWATYNKKMDEICSIGRQLNNLYALYGKRKKAHDKAIKAQWSEAIRVHGKKVYEKD